MRLSRRAALLGAPALLATGARPARAESPDVEVRDLKEDGRRFTLVLPRHVSPTRLSPLAVLLHGLGETANERAGAYAWIERYGLLTAYARLLRPPVAPTTRRGDLTVERAAQISRALAARPFGGLVLACPFMPNVSGDRARTEAYARWVVDALVPRARAEARVHSDDRRVGLCGCSLGGAVSLDVVLAHPGRFGAWSGVQTAIGEVYAASFAARLAAAPLALRPQPRVQLVSSLVDPYLRPTEALSRALAARRVAHELVVAPGPHDQAWLREVGTLEALRFLDQALG